MILDFFEQIIQSNNRVFLSAFFAWFAAQLMKGLISLAVNIQITIKRRKNLSQEEKEEIGMIGDMMSSLLWKTGGMPSSHTSMSSALALAVGFEEGFQSPIFIICFFFTGIVIRDASGVRLLAGRLAKAVNVLIDVHNHNMTSTSKTRKLEKLKIVEGHTISEVFVGLILGIFIAVMMYDVF